MLCYLYKQCGLFVCADQAHSSVERAGLLGGVKLRLLPADEKLRLRGDVLERAIQEDRRNGLIPFYVSTIFVLGNYYTTAGISLSLLSASSTFHPESHAVARSVVSFMSYLRVLSPLPSSFRLHSGVRDCCRFGLRRHVSSPDIQIKI